VAEQNELEILSDRLAGNNNNGSDDRMKLHRCISALRYVTIGLWCALFLRVIFDFVINAFSVFILAIAGTYLLHHTSGLRPVPAAAAAAAGAAGDGDFISSCYSWMRTSIVFGVCGPGGLQCLVPFFVIAIINSTFDIVRQGFLDD
jgi:uncharacterized membrane protein YjjP (DUF1212 family)